MLVRLAILILAHRRGCVRLARRLAPHESPNDITRTREVNPMRDDDPTNTARFPVTTLVLPTAAGRAARFTEERAAERNNPKKIKNNSGAVYAERSRWRRGSVKGYKSIIRWDIAMGGPREAKIALQLSRAGRGVF